MKVTAVQFNVSSDRSRNLERIEALVSEAVWKQHPDLIILPEMSACMTASPARMQELSEPIDGPYVYCLRALAERHHVNIHAGSFVERRGDRTHNTSVVIDRNGGVVGSYSKIHMFDVTLPDGTEARESDFITPGTDIAVIDIEGLKLGLAICYDLRFSTLFLRLADAGAQLIALPSAFTFQTGADHWEVLIRARAIEAQCYVVAPNQCGIFDEKYATWGHSMIVDPWGQVVAQGPANRDAAIAASLDLNYLEDVRRNLPSLKHRVLA